MIPNFPIYIPSKGRADTRMTMLALDRMGVTYRVVVEEQEFDEYAAVIDKSKLIVLDPAYRRDYDTCDDLGDARTKGSGPARNFIWDHAAAEGHSWHWIMDDNLWGFYRLNRNSKIKVGDGTVFRVMEDFCLRYRNIGMAGPNYEMFAPRRVKMPPFKMNTRIYSCNLIRSDIPFRWRGRYNEDTDLSLRILKSGMCTVLFNAFLQDKVGTQRIKGGNTDDLYSAGTEAKSKMIADLHPDVARVTWKYGRHHHHVDYSPFRNNRLVKRDGVEVKTGIDNHGMTIVKAPTT